MNGQSFEMSVRWEDSTRSRDTAVIGNILALLKLTPCVREIEEGCRMGLRQVWWIYTSSVMKYSTSSGCIKPMRRQVGAAVANEVPSYCLLPGPEENKFASQYFTSMPIGYGNFTFMLWSAQIRELIAVSSFHIGPPLPVFDSFHERYAYGGLEAILAVNVTSKSGQVCVDYGGYGSYRMRDDEFVEYCVEGVARYGTSQASILSDSNFTAFGGLLDCVGRHFICTDRNYTCSNLCEFNQSDGYYLPVRPEEKADENIGLAPSTCGDGRMTFNSIEQCDDKNTFDGDGCDSNCQLEPGFFCAYQFCPHPRTQDCRDNLCIWLLVCGDGYTQSVNSEQCDDYNTENGDVCSSTCSVEHCWVCEMMKGVPPRSSCVGNNEEVCRSASCPSELNHTCPICAISQGLCVWYRGDKYCVGKRGFVVAYTITRTQLQTDATRKQCLTSKHKYAWTMTNVCGPQTLASKIQKKEIVLTLMGAFVVSAQEDFLETRVNRKGLQHVSTKTSVTREKAHQS